MVRAWSKSFDRAGEAAERTGAQQRSPRSRDDDEQTPAMRPVARTRGHAERFRTALFRRPFISEPVRTASFLLPFIPKPVRTLFLLFRFISEPVRTAFFLLPFIPKPVRTAFSLLPFASKPVRTAFSLLPFASEPVRTAPLLLRNAFESAQTALPFSGTPPERSRPPVSHSRSPLRTSPTGKASPHRTSFALQRRAVTLRGERKKVKL